MRADSTKKLAILKRIETQDFNGLKENEMHYCWQEMARQIKSFKRKLRKVNEWMQDGERELVVTEKSSCQTANTFLKNRCSEREPKDHQDLIKNLVAIIADGRLSMESLTYQRICSIVRASFSKSKLESIRSNSNVDVLLNLNDKKLPISQSEYNNLCPLLGDEQFCRAYTGTSERCSNLQGYNSIDELNSYLVCQIELPLTLAVEQTEFGHSTRYLMHMPTCRPQQ